MAEPAHPTPSGDEPRLDGQVALVTGGGRGIGRALVIALAAAGARAVALARTRSELDETVALAAAEGLEVTAFEADVLERRQIEETIAAIHARFGAIDLLVNNAGIASPRGAFWEVDHDDWWRTFDVNMRGVSLVTHVVLAGMIARSAGRVINIASDVATRATPRNISYACSKAAVLRFTDCLALATAAHGVSVFALSPGMVRTRLTEGSDAPAHAFCPPDLAARLAVWIASGRLDRLSGRYLHVLRDSPERLVERAEEIARTDRYVLRLTT